MTAPTMFALEDAPSRPLRRSTSPSNENVAPEGAAPNAPVVVVQARPVAAPTVDDTGLLAILEARPRPGETLDAAFRRKEHEIGAAFAALGVLEARALHARLARARPGDVLAARFAGLVVDRRDRLLAFLADARRRAAKRR